MKLNWFNYLEISISLICLVNFIIKRIGWLLAFFVYNFIVTVIGISMPIVKATFGNLSIVLSNCNGIIVFTFYLAFILRNIYHNVFKKLVGFIWIGLAAWWIVWHIFLGNLNKVNSLLYTCFILLIILASCFYLLQFLIFEDDEFANNEVSKLWITCGILIFFSAIAICFSIRIYIYENQLKLFGDVLYRTIPKYMCIILYTCIAIGVSLWKKKPLQQA